MDIGSRIRVVREIEGLGRHKFCEITGINKRTLEKIENKTRRGFAATELEKVGKAFPDYAAFLLTGSATPELEEKLSNDKDYRK